IDKNGHLDYADKSGILDGANGDMGANEVASFDPIFFLHHANIDRMFWVWQKKWHKTGREGDEKFIITNDDKGSKVNGGKSGGQGPTPGQNMGDDLTMDSELRPFKAKENFQTANGCVDIEGQLGYTYTIGSLDQEYWPRLPKRKYEDIGEPESNVPAAPGRPTVRKTTGEHLKSKMKSLKEKIKKKKSGPSAAPKPSTGGGGTPIEIMYEMNHKITSLGKESEEKQEGWPEEFKMVNDSFEIDGTNFKREFYTKVEGIDMNQFYGSFIVITGRRIYDEQSNKYVWTIIHQKAVLARWDKSACKNCQNHSSVDLCFSMGKVLPGDLLKNNWNVWFVFRRMDNHRFAIFPVVPYSDGNGERVPENSYREINHFVRICEMPSKN
uniref:Tyrosinase copper-binding domain-containing protein n=2 Tax=Clytia hemisphaerica TaxID=252671 RepID=A0A7M5TY65_9CNID